MVRGPDRTGGAGNVSPSDKTPVTPKKSAELKASVKAGESAFDQQAENLQGWGILLKRGGKDSLRGSVSEASAGKKVKVASKLGLAGISKSAKYFPGSR